MAGGCRRGGGGIVSRGRGDLCRLQAGARRGTGASRRAGRSVQLRERSQIPDAGSGHAIEAGQRDRLAKADRSRSDLRRPVLDAMMRSMPKSAIRAAGIAILLCLTACSGPPWTLDQSPDGITLRWDPDNTPDAVANSVAQVHCQTWGKNAELISYDQDGSAQLGRYRCR